MPRTNRHTLLSTALLVCAVVFILHHARAQQSPHGPLSIPCTDCHTTASWKELAQPMKFDHSTASFTLQGQHLTVPCAKCHVGGRFSGTSSACYDCHQNEYAKVLMPNHSLGRFSHDCTQCHTLSGWQQSTFQHSKTNFELIGAHRSVACGACHTNNVYAGLSRECFTCHQQDYNQTTQPNHKAAHFDRDCLACHTMGGWKPAAFDHKKTSFPLTGAHQTADCASCHMNGQFKGLATDCYTCHQADFTKVTDPNHATAQFSHNCTDCHTNIAWKPSTFDHNKTNFVLTGAHKNTLCASCHKNGVFKGLPSDCYACHQKDFTRPVNPNHVTSQLSHDCTQCHSTTVWKPSTFNHAATNFPLTGAHQAATCSSCHKNGVYKGLATDCYSCHQTNFAGVASPNHVTAQFSHDCTSCHTTVVWKPSTFNHATTNFALTGAHQTTDCLFCHKNGQFRGTPADCWSCHQGDFTKVTDPNHVSGGFDHVCTLCHTTAAWQPATFDHNKTAFPLTGAHVQTVCAKCHVGGKYAGTPADCYTCHLADFTAAKSPDHAAGQYPHECLTCHSTSAWQPSTFNHDTFFRINSHHRNRASCVDCHRTPGNFKTYSCLTGCHARAHRQNEACYPCHTN